MRYRNLIVFLVALGALGLLVELAFRLSGSPWSLTDRKGVGEVAVFVITLPPLLWFCQVVAGVNPFAFAAAYVRDWRRMLGGFVFMFILGTLVMTLAYVGLGLRGDLVWSREAAQKLSLAIAPRILTALLVALVLATTEELIFRGFVLRYLRSNASATTTVAAVLASAAIFSLSHVVALQSATGAVQYASVLFGLFLLGALLGATYVVTGSIACSIGIHASLLGFKVFFRHTELVIFRPVWWLGGTSDLRMGPVSWLVLALAIGLVVYFRRWLSERFRVETAVCPDRREGARLGFRLEQDAEAAPRLG